MKFASLVLIILAFLASFADSVVCIGHEFTGEKKVVSFVMSKESESQGTQNGFSTFDHCEICPELCSGNLAYSINSSQNLFFSPIQGDRNKYSFIDLKLNSFLSYTERPPAIA